MPAERCADTTDGGCVHAAHAEQTGGSTTHGVRFSRYIFDVPDGVPVRVEHFDLAELRKHADLDSGPDLLGPNWPFVPSPFRRHDVGPPRRATQITHWPTGSTLSLDPKTGRESGRVLFPEDAPPRHMIVQYPTGRFVMDRYTLETIARFPLDRVSILPAVDVLFARTRVDALFDDIVESIRLKE